MSDTDTSLSEDKPGTVQLVYILYLASLLLGITGLIGLIIAYINRSSAPEWLQTHYTFLIHTFWKGVLYSVVGAILVVVLIGIPILLFTIVWMIIRCVKGLKLLGKKEPIPDPRGWMF